MFISGYIQHYLPSYVGCVSFSSINYYFPLPSARFSQNPFHYYDHLQNNVFLLYMNGQFLEKHMNYRAAHCVIMMMICGSSYHAHLLRHSGTRTESYTFMSISMISQACIPTLGLCNDNTAMPVVIINYVIGKGKLISNLQITCIRSAIQNQVCVIGLISTECQFKWVTHTIDLKWANRFLF